MTQAPLGLLKRLFAGVPEAPGPDAAPDAALGADPVPPKSRLGHEPALHAMLGRQILDAHLRNRHQLLDRAPTDFRTSDAEETHLLVLAMSAAAQADGELDAIERGRIRSRLGTSSLDEDARSRLEQLVDQPQCLEELVRRVETPRLAARFYAVSLATVDKNAAINRSYLRYLAQRLGLPADLVVRLNRQMGLRL
ncbi:DUF533 domain-containing protein [Azospirillum melinis]|uniref:DUF533 domain-containing protein n=1 Tax=Azospirillum melinis TaxID=328839 RepID=A0ABX2K6A0_9PROT|nr:DUF533 domain-containing protein [Azospirillum melinis]MBP2306641.1 uncharacterized membrane protein YebE (DUF533 family) [Azospirillum melinis]NUA98001.1 DUF533 domain-containing protein [Azospirillum melinis]